jgi:hypothetical protein
LGIIPIHYEVSTWGMRKNLSYKARTDQYTLAMDMRPRWNNGRRTGYRTLSKVADRCCASELVFDL